MALGKCRTPFSQLFFGFEPGVALRRDGDRFSGARVTSLADFFVLDDETAEAPKIDALIRRHSPQLTIPSIVFGWHRYLRVRYNFANYLA